MLLIVSSLLVLCMLPSWNSLFFLSRSYPSATLINLGLGFSGTPDKLFSSSHLITKHLNTSHKLSQVALLSLNIISMNSNKSQFYLSQCIEVASKVSNILPAMPRPNGPSFQVLHDIYTRLYNRERRKNCQHGIQPPTASLRWDFLQVRRQACLHARRNARDL